MTNLIKDPLDKLRLAIANANLRAGAGVDLAGIMNDSALQNLTNDVNLP